MRSTGLAPRCLWGAAAALALQQGLGANLRDVRGGSVADVEKELGEKLVVGGQDAIEVLITPPPLPEAVGQTAPERWPAWPAPPAIPQRPECNASAPVTVRYATTTKRMYIENVDRSGGCVDLSTVFELRKDSWSGAPLGGARGPLWPVDPMTGERTPNITGTWLLEEELYVEDGVTLNVWGGLDGDCDELRIKSDNGTIINLRAHGANLYFRDTKVFGWDEELNAPRELYNSSTPRSYISAVSEIITDPSETCEGNAKSNMGEARMDIINSEVAYLGYYDSESYGLTWKVRGFCQDKSNPEIFDDVNVYGDIINSDIHHNYFGMYTYGHLGGNWSYNKMHDNYQYGFDPHDDSDWLTIHNNEVWDNGNHGIIASKRCNHVSIQNNHVWGGGQAGLFLHRSTDFAIVKNNYVHDNADAGLACLECFYANIYNNVFEHNKYGVRFSVGSMEDWVHHNTFINSSRYNLYTYLGSDLPDVEGSDGRNNAIYFVENYVYGNGASDGESIKLKQADNCVFEGNMFEEAVSFRYDNSTETVMAGNTGTQNVEVSIQHGACFSSLSDVDPLWTPVCGDDGTDDGGDDDGDDDDGANDDAVEDED